MASGLHEYPKLSDGVSYLAAASNDGRIHATGPTVASTEGVGLCRRVRVNLDSAKPSLFQTGDNFAVGDVRDLWS